MKRNIQNILALVLIAAVILLVSGQLKPPPDFEEVFSRSVGHIASFRDGDTAGGNGFLIDDSGLFLTTEHTIGDRKNQVFITFEGKKSFTADILKTLPEKDLALLQVNASKTDLSQLAYLPITKVLKAKPQDPVYVGFLADASSATRSVEGKLTNLNKTVIASQPLMRKRLSSLIEIDAELSRGSSGAPILDERGQLVGMVAVISADARGRAFGIPAAEIVSFVSE